MIILIILLLFSSNIFSAGFAGKTLLLTDHDQISFDQLNSKMLIRAAKLDVQPILFLHKQYVEQVVQLSFADEIITCHPNQLFWCVNKNSWTCAQDLIIGDLLQTVNEQQIAIDAVQLVQQQTKIYSLTVGPPHYLYVGKHAVLAHNFAWFVGLGVELAFGCGAVEFIKGSIAVALGFVVLKIQNHFAKNKDKKKPKISVTVLPPSNGPQFDPNNDEKDKNKYQNGIYTGSEAHGEYQNGKKSPAPKNGQKALDNSFEFNKHSKGRVAIENDEIVILRRSSPIIKEFHGYRITWDELWSNQKRYSDVIRTLKANKLI
jgi:hypothetical protein